MLQYIRDKEYAAVNSIPQLSYALHVHASISTFATALPQRSTYTMLKRRASFADAGPSGADKRPRRLTSELHETRLPRRFNAPSQNTKCEINLSHDTLESIFLFLLNRDVFTSQLVCKHWKDVIDASPPIQRKLHKAAQAVFQTQELLEHILSHLPAKKIITV